MKKSQLRKIIRETIKEQLRGSRNMAQPMVVTLTPCATNTVNTAPFQTYNGLTGITIGGQTPTIGMAIDMDSWGMMTSPTVTFGIWEVSTVHGPANNCSPYQSNLGLCDAPPATCVSTPPPSGPVHPCQQQAQEKPQLVSVCCEWCFENRLAQPTGAHWPPPGCKDWMCDCCK